MSERKATQPTESANQASLSPEIPAPVRRLGHVSGLFALDRGLFLLPSRIALDVTRRQAIGFISHAHMDHAARHALALCTEPTAKLVQHRFGNVPTKVMPWGESIDVAGHSLKALPAGHILGAAMLHVEHEKGSLLYTGDFNLGQSATAEPAQLCHADYLIMECTFGHPRYRLPPRETVVEMLVENVRQTLRRGATPVISAYVLGKSQEVTKILTSHGIPVLQHPAIYEISQIYQQAGCDLGDFRLYGGRPVTGCAVIVPPKPITPGGLPGAVHVEKYHVTGWAQDPQRRRSAPNDHWIPLSDHADFDQLIQAVEIVAPKAVFCTHGPKTFVDELRSRGHDARWLA
ncbi:MBL fold metallo-hydrolase [Bremerella sp. T1]|uniref:MBL fold metallo-hydrolase n=1 Tax=Bremerella sp. TYQ1 TaxID=3119568 RepID=UPI001CCC6D5B|nr:MBL fold metallo-hydrolase [Bremerella volcania]UBM35297.1 MBL fold metallo-hydrolase [Bremerella volcania]